MGISSWVQHEAKYLLIAQSMLGIHYITSVAEIVSLSLIMILNFLDEPEVEDSTIRSNEACQAPLTTIKNLLLSEAERL